MKTFLIFKIAIICLMAIITTSCRLSINGTPVYDLTSSGSKTGYYSDPYSCKENTELETTFVKAIQEQNLKQIENCINQGVNINGKSCKSESIVRDMGSNFWKRVTVYDEKPFFLEAIATGNYDIVEMFV